MRCTPSAKKHIKRSPPFDRHLSPTLPHVPPSPSHTACTQLKPDEELVLCLLFIAFPAPTPIPRIAEHHTPTAPSPIMLALRPRAIAIPRARTSSRIVLAARIRYYSVVANAPIPNRTKVWSSADEAVKDVKSGDIILSGGAYTSLLLSCASYARRSCRHVYVIARVRTLRHP